MSRELETFLSSLRGATSDVTGVTDRMKALEQEQALKSAYASAPEMMRGGQGMELGAQLAQAGDPFLFREQLKQQMKPQEAPINPDLLKQFIDDPSLVAGLAPKDQLSAAKSIAQRKMSLDSANLQRQEADRRLDSKYSDSAEKALKFVDQRTRKLREKIQSIDNIVSVATDPSVEGLAALDRILKSQAAKALGGDAGNLAVQEVREIIPLTMFESVQKMKNYINNTSASQMPPEVKRGLVMVFQKTLEKTKALEAKEVAFGLNQYAKGSRFIDVEDPFIQDMIQQYDLRVERDKNGFKIMSPMDMQKGKKDANQSAVSSGVRSQGSQETEVTAIVSQIKDPQVKAQAEAAIKAFAGKPIPPEVMTRIKQAAGGQ